MDTRVVRLFGRPSVDVGGREEPLPTRRRALALLAYLALHPGRQPRDRVAFALLPDEGEDAARASMRRQISYLTKYAPLGSGWLVADFRTVGWPADAPLRCDVREFERMSTSDPAEALAHYRGDLVPDLDDAWLEPHRARLCERAFALAAGVARACRDDRTVVEHYARALALGPWDEDIVRDAMRAHVRAGNRAAALAAYRSFAERLELEFSTQPDGRTIALADEIARSGVAAPMVPPPVLIAPLIGRERERDEIDALLDCSRLVTLTGLGGIGKTSLALAVVARRAHRFAAVFVDLAPVRDVAAIETRIATALDVSSARSLADAVVRRLCERPTLLVLDNCEHLCSGVAAYVRELIARDAGIAILATSREALGIAGEHRYAVAPLAPASATVLFAARARAVDARFVLDDGNAAAVDEICRRLDCLPLAIELAAARSAMLAPAQLVERLEHRLRLLATPDSNRDERQQTMSAAIAWSYELLSDRERFVLRRVAVFEGDHSIDAACAVTVPDYDEWETLDALTALATKSLLIADGSERKRYRLLETVRAFARDRSSESELCSAEAARFAFVLAMARTCSQWRVEAKGRDRISEAIMPEFDNVRAAVRWSLELENDIAGGAELVARTAMLLRRRSLVECRAWCARAERHLNRLAPLEAARVLYAGATVATAGVDRVIASDRAVAAARPCGDPRLLADCLSENAFARLRTGDLTGAETAELEALALRRAHGTGLEVADSLDLLAAVAMNRGDPKTAQKMLEEAQRLDPNAVSMRLMFLAEAAFAGGDVALAVEYGREALAAIRAFGDRLNEALACCNLAAYEFRAGRIGRARAELLEALTLAIDLDLENYVAIAVQYLAACAFGDGAVEDAARLLGFADASFGRLGIGRESTEQWMFDDLFARLQSALGAAELDRLRTAGAHMARTHAIAVARGRATSGLFVADARPG